MPLQLAVPPQIRVLQPVPPVGETGGLIDGSAILNKKVPYGCPCAGRGSAVAHNAIQNALATATKQFYLTRQAADDLAATTKESEIRQLAKRAGAYAHDLEFLGRSMAMVLKMPVAVNPPFLPFDMKMAKTSSDKQVDAAAAADAAPGEAKAEEDAEVKAASFGEAAVAAWAIVSRFAAKSGDENARRLDDEKDKHPFQRKRRRKQKNFFLASCDSLFL
ncbi:unnamed protein product [Amoebophrya sp. A120]|nr:unnamed protein product [Amoebophrya sp. A120]|eukprot:GSA120T00020228001.1